MDKSQGENSEEENDEENCVEILSFHLFVLSQYRHDSIVLKFCPFFDNYTLLQQAG
jgi:hypothetical protein